MLAVIWVFFVVRWAFPRFRYDQIMRLGWKMMLPVSLANVAITGAVFLWRAARRGMGRDHRVDRVLVLRRFLAARSGKRGRGKPFNYRGGALTWTSHTTSARAPDRRPT